MLAMGILTLLACDPTAADFDGGQSGPRGGAAIGSSGSGSGGSTGGASTGATATSSGGGATSATGGAEPLQTWIGEQVFIMYTPDGLTEIDRCEALITASVQPT